MDFAEIIESTIVAGSSRSSGELGEVVGGADQCPFRLHFVDATQQDLANSIGSVREVVARAIDELCRDGFIERTKAGIRVLDPDRLEAEALA